MNKQDELIKVYTEELMSKFFRDTIKDCLSRFAKELEDLQSAGMYI